MPPEQVIRIIRAKVYTLRFKMAPQRDITSWTIEWKVKEKIAGTTSLTKTTASGITRTDEGRGIIEIAITKANTSSLTPSKDLDDTEGYTWELARTDSGSEKTLARGQLILEEEIIA